MVLLSQAPVSQHRTRASRGVLCSASSNSHYIRTDEGDLPKAETEQAPYPLGLSTTQPGSQPDVPSHGVRTDLCHIRDQNIPVRDISNHLKQHNIQRKSRYRSQNCSNCSRTLDGADTAGARSSSRGINSGICLCCSTRSEPIPILSEHDYGRYLQYKRRSRKARDKNDNEIWPDFVEEAFQAGRPREYVG